MSDSKVTTLDAPSKDKVAATKAEATQVVKGSGHDTALSGKTVVVTVAMGQGDLGKVPVEVQLNGYLYRWPRGVPAEVPVEVLSILDNAVETEWDEVPGSKGAEFVQRKVPRFNVNLAR